jgi:uncharacterized membrane protein
MPPRRRDAVAAASLAAFFTVVYSLIGLFRHWRFGSSAFDLGIFDQAIWHASRFEAPASTVSGFTNILGDHFYPIVLAFAPLYWVKAGPETLIAAQAVLFGLSIVPVFQFIRRRLELAPTVLLCAACGFFWGLQRAAAFDVHEIAFAPLFIALAILNLDRRRWPVFWVSVAGIALIKEDLLPFLTGLGVFLVAQGERRRGVMLLAASTIAFVVVVTLVVPWLSDTGAYQHAGSFAAVARQPWRLPMQLVTPPAKIETALMWLAPFAFLPLLSRHGWLLVPFALTRLLSDTPSHWGTRFHYAAPLAPVLAMSAADALTRLQRRVADDASRRRLINGLAGATLLFSLILPGNQPFWDLFEAEHYRPKAGDVAGRRALAAVPPDVSVVAQAALVPHLSRRRQVYVLEPGAPPGDYVIASTAVSPYPNATPEAVMELVRARIQAGYTIVFDEMGWIVLRAPGVGPGQPSPAEGGPPPRGHLLQLAGRERMPHVLPEHRHLRASLLEYGGQTARLIRRHD